MEPTIFSRTGDPGQPPVHAATVVLLRRGSPFEVFLVQRARRSAFMGGVYVFPGGKLDEADCSDRMRERIVGRENSQALEPMPGETMTEARAAGLHIAGARELFEEVGVLLARRKSDGGPVDLGDDVARRRFDDHRGSLRASKTSFVDILESEDLEVHLHDFRYWAHWITPSRELRRYDTRFFLADLPEGQRPLCDESETIAGAWMSPTEAVDAYRAERIELAPPTLRSLEDLGAFASLDAVFASIGEHPIFPILPKVGIVDETIAILLPWDPLYSGTEGEGVTLVSGPRPSADRISRVVLEGQKWVSRAVREV